MSIWAVIGIIALVLGIIISNLLLLKHSANMKPPKSVLDAIEEKKLQQAIKQNDDQDIKK